MPVLIPIILLAAGVGVVVALALASVDRPVPVHEPEVVEPAVAKANGYDARWGKDDRGRVKVYPLVDKLLPGLQRAASATGIPLGLMVGWIARESGGKLATKPQPGPGDTKLDERGIYQIHPSESKSLGLDHQRLSTDVNYSLEAGLALIQKYMAQAESYGVTSRGTTFFFLLTKLAHTMGSGAAKKIVEMAKAAGATRSWNALEDFALSHESEIMHAVKHSPSKWMPFVDAVYRTGAPFGFGSQDVIVGGEVFNDIVDPLDALGRG